MFEPRVGDHVHDLGAVLQLAQLLGSEKTHPREIRFHSEDTVELDGMPDRFVNLQAKLRAAEDDRALSLRALRGGVQRDTFFGDARCVADEVERFDQLVALQHVLAAEAIRIRALLDFGALEAGGDDARARLHLDLVNR